VLGFEFTGAPTRYYPIELPENRALNERYKSYILDVLGAERTYFAGRLANYVYIDMDDCMRQALDAAEELLHDLSRRPRQARVSSD
jgi:UDP-galactopyranose mutase